MAEFKDIDTLTKVSLSSSNAQNTIQISATDKVTMAEVGKFAQRIALIDWPDNIILDRQETGQSPSYNSPALLTALARVATQCMEDAGFISNVIRNGTPYVAIVFKVLNNSKVEQGTAAYMFRSSNTNFSEGLTIECSYIPVSSGTFESIRTLDPGSLVTKLNSGIKKTIVLNDQGQDNSMEGFKYISTFYPHLLNITPNSSILDAIQALANNVGNSLIKLLAPEGGGYIFGIIYLDNFSSSQSRYSGIVWDLSDGNVYTAEGLAIESIEDLDDFDICNDIKQRPSNTYSLVPGGVYYELSLTTLSPGSDIWKVSDDTFAPLKAAYDKMKRGETFRYKISNAYDLMGVASIEGVGCKARSGFYIHTRVVTSGGGKDLSYLISDTSGVLQ